MLDSLGYMSLYGLIILMVFNVWRTFFSKDHSLIWSPIVFITLIYFYYVIWPYFWGDTDYYGVNTPDATNYNLIAAFVSYLGIYIMFYSPLQRVNFASNNRVFTDRNSNKLAIVLLIIGFTGYISFKGFTLSLFSSGDTEWNKGGDFAFYFTDLISLGCASCSLLTVKSKNKLLIAVAILLTLYFYILCGFRYRIVMLGIAIFTVWHLYPSPKKINYKVVVPIALVAFFLFALMEGARRYGVGLDRDAVADFDVTQTRGASENSNVFTFTGYTIAKSVDQDMILFEPLWCAVTLPIPRAIFPSKPNADYLRNISTSEFGGAAFTYYAEAYLSFGWIGVFLYGLLVGWISKRVWNNYLINKFNINAILFLALFNGTLYVLISRGYMAQALQTFIYFVLLPFWLSRAIKAIYFHLKK